MCFLMHNCGCALLAAKATADQGERWLRPAAAGSALATLAFSERVTGAHFYQPDIRVTRQDGTFQLSGRKSFVTSGGHAQLYPVLVQASGAEGLDILLVTPDMAGIRFDGQWDGLGAEMSVAVQGARQLVQEAARAATAGEETALPLVMQAKVAATSVAAAVTAQGMRVGGGIAYSRQLALERHWRDAHAGGVMAPTNEVLRGWLGRLLAGLPLF